MKQIHGHCCYHPANRIHHQTTIQKRRKSRRRIEFGEKKRYSVALESILEIRMELGIEERRRGTIREQLLKNVLKFLGRTRKKEDL